MKTRMIKSITMMGIGAVLIGGISALPAMADGRRDDGCRPAVQVRYNDGDRYNGPDNDRRDNDRRDNDRRDNGRRDNGRRDDRR